MDTVKDRGKLIFVYFLLITNIIFLAISIHLWLNVEVTVDYAPTYAVPLFTASLGLFLSIIAVLQVSYPQILPKFLTIGMLKHTIDGAMKTVEEHEKEDGVSAVEEDASIRNKRLLIFMVSIVIFVILVPVIGIAISFTFFIATSMFLLGERSILTTVIAIVSIIVFIYLIFIRWLYVDLSLFF